MIGKRISALRNERGLTQQAVAEGIGISRATYAHYEIDRREPDNTTLRKLARFFDVSADYLLELTDLPKPYVLSKESPFYDRVLKEVSGENITPADMRTANSDLADFMQDNKIGKSKANLDLLAQSGLSADTLEKLAALIRQIKKETTKE